MAADDLSDLGGKEVDLSDLGGKPAAQHDLSDLGGKEVDLSDLGGKPSGVAPIATIPELGKEKTFMERAEAAAEFPQTPAPLGQRMMDITPEKTLKAAAVGLEEAIPAPTTALAAGLLSARETLAQGRPQTSQDIQSKYAELSKQKEGIKEEAPGIADITSTAIGTALPLPTGAGTAAKAAAAEGSGIAKGLEQTAQKLAVSSTKATPKQLAKLERYNPGLGKFLLDEGVVTAGRNVEDLQAPLRAKLTEVEGQLNKTYESIDALTGGKTVPVEAIVARMEAAKAGLSRAHTNDAIRETLDTEIKTLRSRYPEGHISAREAQEIKSAFGQTGYGQTTLPGSRVAAIDRKVSRVYKDALDEATQTHAPEIAAALKDQNQRASNLKAAYGIVTGKSVPGISPTEYAVGVGASFGHPAAIVTPLVTHAARTRGTATAAAAARTGAEALQGAAELFKNKELIDAAVRAVGVETVNNVVNQYGPEDPRTATLLLRLATRGEQQ